MLAELFSVVGCDDHERFFEQTTAVHLVEELPQPVIDVGNTIVVGIAHQVVQLWRNILLGPLAPFHERRDLVCVTGLELGIVEHFLG